MNQSDLNHLIELYGPLRHLIHVSETFRCEYDYVCVPSTIKEGNDYIEKCEWHLLEVKK